MINKRILAFLCCWLPSILAPSVLADNSTRPLTVFAAASLTDVLEKHAVNWAKKSGEPIPTLSFAASAIMARQIKAGAPADIFISANPEWVHFLLDANAASGPPQLLAENQLVFAQSANKVSAVPAPTTAEAFLATVPDGRIVLADPDTAPAGSYAKAYMEKLGIWQRLRPRLAFGNNVRQTLLLIERGGLSGFVYRSDALRSKLAEISFAVPRNFTGTVQYQGIKISQNSTSADTFLAYLISPASKSIWEQEGFMPPVSK